MAVAIINTEQLWLPAEDLLPKTIKIKRRSGLAEKGKVSEVGGE